MSDQFDQLFKDKINSKEYQYSAKAWRSYTQRAGIAKFAVGKVITIVASSLVVLSVGGYFLYQQLSKTSLQTPITAESQSIVPPEENNIAIDTSLSSDTIEEKIDVSSENQKKTTKWNRQEVKTTDSSVIHKSPDTISTPSVQRKPIIRKKPNRRILEINPDTIPTND